MAKFNDESVRSALAGRMAVREYPLPGAESVMVGVRLLRDEEMDAVRLQAQQFVLTKKCELAVDPEFLDRAIKRELISRAFVDAEKTDEAFFGSQASVAELDAPMVLACFELYNQHQMMVDPYAHCSEEEVAELVELLGKSPDREATLRLFDAPTLRSFVISLAATRRES
jgi:hypothetical protein